MEVFLLLASLALGLALLVRSVNDRERLHKLETEYQGQLDSLKQVTADQQNEILRLRGMSLELLKAQTAVRGRLNELIESGGLRQLPAAAPSGLAAPAEPIAPPASEALPVREAPRSAGELAAAVVSAAGAAGLHAPTAEDQADPRASQITPGRAVPAPTPAEWVAPPAVSSTPETGTEAAPEAAPPAESPPVSLDGSTPEPAPLLAALPPPDAMPAPPPPAFTPPLAATAPPPAEAAPPPKPAPSFDWETLLGVRGAAWLGAIALVIAGTLFAKYSIENDLIRPPLRIALLILLSVTALGSSELFLRPRYTPTANAICGGGIAILYAALFAAHNLYDLLGLLPTFLLMALTTATAALLSLRYQTMYIAVLGMLGGFATPLALSTGQDRPYALFAYVLMLDLGFLGIAVRRGWHRLALLNLVATMLMEAGWAGRFLSPVKMPIAVGVALVFAFLFMALPVYLRNLPDKQRREVLYGAGTAGLLPFVFAWVLATHPQYGRNWPLLFGFIACLELGLLWVAVRRWPVLALLAMLATAATHALWDLTSLTPALMTVAVASALALALPLWLLPRVHDWLAGASAELPSPLRLAAALGSSAPLVLFCALAGQSDYGVLWLRLLGGAAIGVAALLWLALRRVPLVAMSTAALAALLLGLWTASTLQPALTAPLLAATLALALLFLSSVVLAARQGAEAAPTWARRGAALYLVAALLLHCRLFGDSDYGSRWPLLFASLACLNGCVLWLGVRGNPLLIRVGLGLTIVCHALWIGTSMTTAQVPLAMGMALLFGLPYLALPTLHRGDEPAEGSSDATLAAVAPFALALYLASTPAHAQRWALLFGFVAVLDAVLVTMALWRKRAFLLLVACAATSLTELSWAATALRAETLWGGTLCALFLSAALGALPRLWAWRLQLKQPSDAPTVPEWAGVATLVGLLLYAAQLIQRGLAEPPWAFLLLLALLTALLIERTRRGGIAWTAPIGGLVLSALVQGWFVASLPAESRVAERLPADVLLRNLSVPLLLAAVLGVAAALRTSRWRSERAAAPADPADPAAVAAWSRVARQSELGALLAALTALLGLVAVEGNLSVGPYPGLLFTAYLVLDLLILAIAARQQWTWLGLLALGLTALGAALWQSEHFQRPDAPTALAFLTVLYLFFLGVPLLMLRALPPLRSHRSLFFTAALAGPLFFKHLYVAWLGLFGDQAIGVLPVLQAALSVGALAVVQGLAQPTPTAKLPAELLARRHLGHRALFAAVALGFLATAIPLQLDRQWIAVAWALEAAGVWWLYRRLPHPGLKYFGLLLYAAVAFRLVPTHELLHYHRRGLPVLNWLLYSYGVPSVCFLVGAAGLRPVEGRYRSDVEKRFPVGNERVPLHGLVTLAGLLLVFALINLEITDAFSPGPYTELWLTRSYARDLTRSTAWGVYALTLLVIGMVRDSKELRYFSLGIVLLTIAKVFLYDLSNIGGIYRSLSFLGLAISLILVSLLYQRFVFKTQSRLRTTDGGAAPPKQPKPADAGAPPEGTHK